MENRRGGDPQRMALAYSITLHCVQCAQHYGFIIFYVFSFLMIFFPFINKINSISFGISVKRSIFKICYGNRLNSQSQNESRHEWNQPNRKTKKPERANYFAVMTANRTSSVETTDERNRTKQGVKVTNNTIYTHVRAFVRFCTRCCTFNFDKRFCRTKIVLRLNDGSADKPFPKLCSVPLFACVHCLCYLAFQLKLIKMKPAKMKVASSVVTHF